MTRPYKRAKTCFKCGQKRRRFWVTGRQGERLVNEKCVNEQCDLYNHPFMEGD